MRIKGLNNSLTYSLARPPNALWANKYKMSVSKASKPSLLEKMKFDLSE